MTAGLLDSFSNGLPIPIDSEGEPSFFDVSSANFPTFASIQTYLDDQGLQPIGFIVEDFDHNHSDPGTGEDHNYSDPGDGGDHNYSDPGDYNGTDPGEHNDTQGLPVFALDVTQAETLIDGLAPAGSYAIEIFMDYDTGMEYRLLIGAVELDGLWEREFDAIGNPVELPISSAHFPTPDAIYQYIDQQNLEPIGYIIEQHDHNESDPGGDYNGTDPGTGGDHNGTQGLPVFALTMNQAETLMDGYAPAGSYAVEIFMDYQTGIEQRLLVSAIQLDGEWEREFDAIGNPVESPISSAHFPTADSIYQYIDQQNLEPIGFITEDPQEHDPEDPQNSGTDKDHEELPVFALPGGVVTILAPSAPNTGGNYVVEFYTDLTIGANLKKLVAVEKVEGQWQRTIDPISGYIEGYPLNADFTDMEFVMTYLGWQGITDADILGYITDGEAGGDGPPSEENHSPSILRSLMKLIFPKLKISFPSRLPTKTYGSSRQIWPTGVTFGHYL